MKILLNNNNILKSIENTAFMDTHDYARFARQYADLGIVDSFYLAYRDVPNIVKHYVTGKDWTENTGLQSGDKAKVVVHGTDITLYDYVWTDSDYQRAFKDAGLELLEMRKPLASENEPFTWYAERELPLWVVYTLRKQ